MVSTGIANAYRGAIAAVACRAMSRITSVDAGLQFLMAALRQSA